MLRLLTLVWFRGDVCPSCLFPLIPQHLGCHYFFLPPSSLPTKRGYWDGFGFYVIFGCFLKKPCELVFTGTNGVTIAGGRREPCQDRCRGLRQTASPCSEQLPTTLSPQAGPGNKWGALTQSLSNTIETKSSLQEAYTVTFRKAANVAWCSITITLWGCYPLVLWNVSKAGPHSLLFLTLSGPVVSSSHLSKEQAPLRMLLASWTVALKENCLTPLHKNSKKERIPGTAGKPRCPWSNSKVLRRCIFTASQKHEILFFKSPDYRLVPFVLPLCFLLDMNLLRSIEIDLLLKFFCANLPLFVGIYV